MSNETYRQFDPWRPSPVKEIFRRQIVETHYFNVDHVSYESNQIGSFERYFVQELNGDTVAVLAVTEDGMIPLVEQYRLPTIGGHWRFRLGTPTILPNARPMWPSASWPRKPDSTPTNSRSSPGS